MTADPITRWLGTPDQGNSPDEELMPKAGDDDQPDQDSRCHCLGCAAESAPKAIDDDPSRDPVGTVRLYGTGPRDDTGLVIRWRDPADTTEPYPWLILGSDGPQKLSSDSVQGCVRVGAILTRGDGVTTTMPRLQTLRLPGERFILVVDNVADHRVFDGVNMDRIRDHLGAAAVLVLAFPVEVL